MMQFLGIPWWTAGLLAAGCGVCLYILHRLFIRPQKVVVVTSMFWEKASTYSQARTLPGRFRYLLTYCLLLFICGLLIFALMHPVIGNPGYIKHCVLVLDSGFTMAAVNDQKQSRWIEAIETAKQFINDDTMTTQWAVLAADPEPRLIHCFDDISELFRINIEGVKPTRLPANRYAALQLANSLLNGKTNPEIMVITDQPLIQAKVSDYPCQVTYINDSAENAALLSAHYDTYPDNPGYGRLYFRVGYWGATTEPVRLSVLDDSGSTLWEKSVNLDPDNVVTFHLDNIESDGRALMIRINCDDDLKIDNALIYKLPDPDLIKIRIAGQLANPLRLVFENNPYFQTVDQSDDCDVTVTDHPTSTSGQPALIIQSETEGTAVHSGSRILFNEQVFWPESWLTDWPVCGSGTVLQDLPEDAIELLKVKEGPMAAFTSDENGSKLYLSSALLSRESTFWKKPGFLIFLTQSLRLLAVQELLAVDTVRWMFGDLEEDRLMSVENGQFDIYSEIPKNTQNTDMDSKARQKLDLLSLIIVIALTITVVEFYLFTKGRIV